MEVVVVMKVLQRAPSVDLPAPAERTIPDAAAMLPEALADLVEQTGGQWVIWYGHYTRRWWAMPRAPYPWFGLVEGHTPPDLLVKVREIEEYYGLRRFVRAPVGAREAR